MSLPYMIEYLLTLRDEDGASLVYQGAFQTVIPQFPPATQVVLDVYPYPGYYFYILFNWSFDRSMVPNAFYAWGTYFGNRTYDGIVLPWWIDTSQDVLVYMSESEPAVATILNRTTTMQHYSAVTQFIAVDSERTYETVLKALERVGSSAESERLAAESVRLLKKMTGESPDPPPPPPGQGRSKK